MKKTTILLLAALAGQFWLFPSIGQAAEPVKICFGSASSALLPIAKEQGFFKAAGVEVAMLPYTSGKDSIQAMLDGKCDLATVAQTPVVHHSLSRRDFLILANLSVSDDFEKIIVRRDRGINKPADLAGRRFALPRFATQHYLLDTYLTTNGLAPETVERRYVHHNEALKLFRAGEVDGIVHREPEVAHLLAEFGGRAKVLNSRSLCVSVYLLVGRRDFVEQQPRVIEKLLHGLVRAEDFARRQPAAAQEIAARTYGADREQIKLIWGLHNYRISLDQSLLFILENMARWETGLMEAAPRPAMPDYLEFIYFDALHAVRPEAVTIIH